LSLREVKWHHTCWHDDYVGIQSVCMTIAPICGGLRLPA
jgi:hypothetical protein